MVRYPVNTTISICSLASLIKYWESQGGNITSASELIHQTVEMVTEVLILQGLTQRIEDPSIADHIISSKGLKTKNMNDRGRNALIKHLQRVELKAISSDYMERPLKKPSGVSSDDMKNYVQGEIEKGSDFTKQISQILEKGTNDGRQAAKDAADLMNPLEEGEEEA